VTSYAVLKPGYASRRLRTWLFIGLGVSGVVPVAHTLAVYGLAYSRAAFGLDWLAIGGAFYVSFCSHDKFAELAANLKPLLKDWRRPTIVSQLVSMGDLLHTYELICFLR
jgi:hypothetical protein